MASSKENRIVVEMDTLHKQYLTEAGKLATFDGPMRNWILPILFREAEKALGMSFDQWLLKKEVSNESNLQTSNQD